LIGGIAVSFLMELLVYPVVFYLWKRRELPKAPTPQHPADAAQPTTLAEEV
jgi:Cu(I)/Ag(I) efflux system membrane protein CusA/SilA